jgi:hypothetical protein
LLYNNYIMLYNIYIMQYSIDLQIKPFKIYATANTRIPGQIPAEEPGLIAGWLSRATFTTSTAGSLCFYKPILRH